MENEQKLPYNIHRLEEGERIESFDCIDAIPFYLKNEFEVLTDNDKEDRHTRLLFFDQKLLLGKD